MVATQAIARTQNVPYFAGNGRIAWRDRPVPEPGQGELLIRIRANALCGTDRQQLSAGSDVTPGHEAAGEVAAAGPGTVLPTGTLGVIYLMDFCGSCRSCRMAATNQCRAKRADVGFTHDGGYGRFALVHQTNFFPVDPGISPAVATLLLDVMGTAGHALKRAAAIRQDTASILVAGAGPVGLGVVAMARLILGRELPIVVTDLAPYRLALARRLGAEAVLLPQDTIAGALEAAGIDDGADIAIDTSGRADGRRMLLDALGRRGVLVCVGHGEDLHLSVSEDLIAPERTVMGSEYFRYDELPGNLALLSDNRQYLSQIVTHLFPLERLKDAYDLFLAGESGKVVIEQ